MNQTVRRLALAATLLGALVAPATAAFASDHGGSHGRGPQHRSAPHGHKVKPFLGGHKHKLEAEAVIVSVAPDGSSMVLQPTNSSAVTATVIISSSTVITADEGVTTTTLAAGERVHVVVVDDNGSKVAQLVVIESTDASGDVKGGDGNHGSKGGNGGDHHGQTQFEGVIVSVAPDGSSIVLQRPNSPNITATITISSSTVITADEGVTTTALAAGEQVHVKAQQVNGVFVATRIEIQKPEAQGDHGSKGGKGGDHHGQAQFEGVVVSVAPDGSSIVLQNPESPDVTVTITISSSTVITADEGVTTTALAAGEQVHVQAQQVNGVIVATRIEIQKPEANGDHNPGGDGSADDNGQSGNGNPGNAGSAPSHGPGHGDHSGGHGGGNDSGGSGSGHA